MEFDLVQERGLKMEMGLVLELAEPRVTGWDLD